ncbi:helix-turn-helix transcriptional regulator [Halosegnis marinus]|uniref:helix-turn-helix transcriptional regulator n=1 Tax=Halosegnis marinus TaxID=3034023 RepID=UPI0036068866
MADDEPDFDLLSDEERVEYLLERNGGRMKQATIVEETGWSNAKVSQLLSAMDEAGRVNKLRIGRENLISLPGEDVAELGTDRD